MKTVLVLVVAGFAGSACVYGDSIFYSLDPKSSFVEADLGNSFPYLPDKPDNPLIVPVTPGTTITLIAEGGICYAGSDPNGNMANPCYTIGNQNLATPETPAELGGVFSANPTLLDDSNLQRIPGAISSGLADYTDPYYTSFYFDRNVSTVNPFDFLIPYVGVTLVVPAGANYLFLAVYDSYYADNTDPNATLGIEVITPSIPEPGTFAMLLAGAGGLLAFRRTKERRQ
jgi:hypothetical protein